MNPRRILLSLLLGTSTASVAAADTAPWESSASVAVSVNGHAFHDARVRGHGCGLTLELLFEAPEKGYSDPKNVVRNYALFQARVRFARGQTVTSKIFGNGAPGNRVYTFETDSAGAGCWAKERNTIAKLDVIGCRGRSCALGAFD